MNNNKTGSECQTAKLFVVYVIWCRVTGKHYVGITLRKVEKRIREHVRGKNQLIDREIKRLGWEGNWDWWVVESDIPDDLINEREKIWINFFDAMYPAGYNKTSGGIHNFTASKNTRKKIRQARLGKKRKPFTAEHLANLSKSRMGEKNPFFGKHHTEEAKEKNRQAHLGKPLSEEHKAKIGEKSRGRKASEKTRAILREKTLAQHARRRAEKAAKEAAAQETDQTTP